MNAEHTLYGGTTEAPKAFERLQIARLGTGISTKDIYSTECSFCRQLVRFPQEERTVRTSSEH